MLILALETSCDETAAALLEIRGNKFSLLSSLIASQAKLHTKTQGVVPEVAARAHIEIIAPLIEKTIRASNRKLSRVDVVAVTTGPGLAPSLMVGVDTAKALAFALNKPIIAINHIEAHIYSPFISDFKFQISDFKNAFPAISLVVSGGHTELFLVRGWLDYKKLGATLDDAAGECFDKCARLLNLPYPGGPALAKLAEKGRPTIPFPRPMIKSENFDFSFSGLKTAVLYYLRDRKLKALGYKLKANLAASIQAAIVDVLVAKTLAAAKKNRTKTILLGGGVAANRLLREQLKAACQNFPPKADPPPAENLKFFAAAKNFSTDNAAMIAFAGYLHARKRQFTPLHKVRANANWEL